MKLRILALTVALAIGCSADDPSNKKGNNSNNVNNVNNVNNSNNVNNVNNVNNGDMAVEGQVYRIATFNVRRFFDTVCDSTACGGDAFEDVNSDAEFAFKADVLAEAIDGLDVDAVMLQELETQDCLDGLMDRTEVFDFGVLGETGFRGSLDVAVLSRGEMTQVVSHKEDTLPVPGGGASSFTRDFLEVHVDLDGQDLILFSAHFKSKRNDDPERRLAEAVGAEKIVSAVSNDNPDAIVVMGGDLNDEPGSAPINALDDGDLVVLSEPDIWTYQYFDDQSQIDHLVVPENNGADYVSGSLEAIRDSRSGYGPSDHSALVAEFIIPEEMQ